MNQRRSRTVPPVSLAIETLEGRLVMSGLHANIMHPGVVEAAGTAVRKVATVPTMSISAGTLNQPITITVTVRAPASAGSPVGTVNIVDQNMVIQTLNLSPTTSTNPRFAYSQATYTLTQAPGTAAYFFGKHRLVADFVPGAGFSKSTTAKSFTVGEPAATTLAGGVKIATITAGTGPQIQTGQTANLTYTGYLATTGQVFDDSLMHGGTPFSFPVGEGQVIPGFDTGVAGMQVGESRIIMMPPAEAYGSTANGPIPPNSTLFFVVTLQSIS